MKKPLTPVSSTPFRLIPAAGCFLMAASLAFAQAADSGKSGEGNDDSKDEVVQLSDFMVYSSPDDGYGASMTSTGSRVAEKIKNLPYSIEVITSEMMDDLAFTDLGEDFAYVSSFGGFDAGSGNINLRGLGVGKQLRNGFLRIGVIDKANIERIEVIKGPSAAIYGESLPAGLINIVTKKPKTKPAYKLTTRVGTNDLFRVDAEATGPLTKKLAYIVDVSRLKQGYDEPYASLNTTVYSGAVSYQFSPDTSLLVDAEYISRANVPSAPIPVRRTVVDGVTRNEDLATEIAGFNWYGPYELTQREVTTFDATFEHRFNSVWSLRAAANWFKRETEGRNNNIAGGVNPTYNTTGTNAGKLTGFVPGYGYAHETGYGAQIDLTAHYWLLNRVLENRTLLTFDYSDYTREDPQWRATASNAAAVGFPSVQDPNNPVYFWPSPEDYPDLYTLYRSNHNSTDVLGIFLRHQTAAWQGRFIVVGGIRYDLVMEDLHRYTEMLLGTGLENVVDHSEGHFTPNTGINFSILKGIRGYANYSKSFFVSSQTNSAPAYGQKVDPVNEGGYGLDYGIKAGMFDDKLNFTLGGFYIVRENVKAVDENGDSRRIGHILSRGLEFDSTYRIVSEQATTNVRLGYGFTNARYANNGNDLDALQRTMAGMPTHNAYLALNRVWKRGALKGFSLSVGLTYTGSSYPWTNRGGTQTAFPDGTVYILSNSGYRDIKIPAYFSTRASLGYSWRTGKFQHSVSVACINLMDDDYIQRNRALVPKQSWSFAYTLKR